MRLLYLSWVGLTAHTLACRAKRSMDGSMDGWIGQWLADGGADVQRYRGGVRVGAGKHPAGRGRWKREKQGVSAFLSFACPSVRLLAPCEPTGLGSCLHLVSVTQSRPHSVRETERDAPSTGGETWSSRSGVDRLRPLHLCKRRGANENSPVALPRAQSALAPPLCVAALHRTPSSSPLTRDTA